jgi:hypothetical protein
MVRYCRLRYQLLRGVWCLDLATFPFSNAIACFALALQSFILNCAIVRLAELDSSRYQIIIKNLKLLTGKSIHDRQSPETESTLNIDGE